MNKYFSLLMLLVFLASCGTSVSDTQTPDTSLSTNETEVDDITQDLLNQIENTMEEEENMLKDESAVSEENQVSILDAWYSNPQWPVNMVVNYSADARDTITSIEVSANNWDLSDFNAAAQSLVGQNISEWKNLYVAWASLTSASFNQAIKNR